MAGVRDVTLCYDILVATETVRPCLTTTSLTKPSWYSAPSSRSQKIAKVPL